MDTLLLLIFIGPLIGGLVLYWIISSLVRVPGRALATKFVSMSVLKGKTKEDIIKVVGPPNAVSATPDGGQLLQWMATGYHIALIFDVNGICQGVTHEVRV